MLEHLKEHCIYTIKLDTTPFYIGYCGHTWRIKWRLEEHIEGAINPDDYTIERRLVMGGPSDKDAVIIAAIENNIPLSITAIHSVPRTCTIYEQDWIDQYKQQYWITNRAKGGVWCPGLPTVKTKTVKQPVITVNEPKDTAFDKFLFDQLKHKLLQAV